MHRKPPAICLLDVGERWTKVRPDYTNTIRTMIRTVSSRRLWVKITTKVVIA